MEIPWNATIRLQYVKCGEPQCQKKHGTYPNAFWKEGNRTNSRYVGKKLEDINCRKIAKDQDRRLLRNLLSSQSRSSLHQWIMLLAYTYILPTVMCIRKLMK
jgi:hypothetical protein